MELHRVDYTILGLTSKKCMKLLPSTGAKFTQKVVVGDQEGITQIFFVKRGELQITFKSLPSAPITNIVLGGSIGTPQDKIFASFENIVRGYTKKGKIFLNFETQLLETIKCMYVCGNDLIVSGLHNYHHYHDCKLVDSYTCSDIINDIITLNVAKVRRLTAILACADHTLRVLDGSTVTQSLILPNSPTALHLMNGDGGTTGDHILVGMQEGQIYLVQITRSNSTIIKWILENEHHKSEITCMTCFDLMKTGIPDIIIGRHDGNIEVYTMIQHDEVTNEFKPPVNKFSYSCNESVTSVQGGYIGNVNFEEIVITTYTGWLFGLTTEVPEKQLTSDANDLNYGFSREEKQKILKLKSEIEELEARITKERERYLAFTQEDSAGISRLPYLTINDKMILHKDDATYFIMLESETNIDNVLIQCDVPIKLLDVDKNSAVVSYSKCDIESGNAVLATYRCQLNTVRLELKFYVDEGLKGTLQAYVTPLTQPKSCQVRKYSIKPLSLHCRVHMSESERYQHVSIKFYNVLQLKGTFSVAEIHTWITQCLPELPEKPPDEEKITYIFKSTLIDTVLECIYSRGEAEFKSDNISTIAILKDILSKEATKKKIKLDISSTTNEQSIVATLQLVNIKLQKYFELHQQSMLLSALKDIDSAQEEPIQNNLIPEYKEILNKEKEIQNELKQRPFYLERLQNAVLNLYLDWHKFKGINIKPKLAAFNNSLKNNYNFQEICSYFSL